jgi:divalent metal cation (Fe/Co/Zn/Cd) transporter
VVRAYKGLGLYFLMLMSVISLIFICFCAFYGSLLSFYMYLHFRKSQVFVTKNVTNLLQVRIMENIYTISTNSGKNLNCMKLYANFMHYRLSICNLLTIFVVNCKLYEKRGNRHICNQLRKASRPNKAGDY